MLNKIIVDLIQDAVMGDEAYEVHGSVLSVGYDVLKELGLVREDREGELGATPRLIRIFVEVYYYRRADEIIKGKYPAVPHDRRRGALLFAPLVRPKQPL